MRGHQANCTATTNAVPHTVNPKKQNEKNAIHEINDTGTIFPLALYPFSENVFFNPSQATNYLIHLERD